MDVSQAFAQAHYYSGVAKQLAETTQKESSRVLSLKILFHLPDYPGILQEFMHQFDDRFTQTDNLVRDIQRTQQSFQKVATTHSVDAVNAVAGFLIDTINMTQTHVQKMYNTKGFEIPFHKYDATLHDQIIEEVPFSRLKLFLAHWHQKIDAPLHTAIIHHAPAARMN